MGAIIVIWLLGYEEPLGAHVKAILKVLLTLALLLPRHEDPRPEARNTKP